MRFSCQKPKENVANLARILGYRLLKGTDDEFNFVRPLARDYPRFHLYLREKGNNLSLNLHLDQKKPSYKGQTRHSGEYGGELVEAEKQRINSILEKMGS
ncbi:MAG: hypothetical protein Q8N16_00495 [bacterium]|nr:hypothetical protein [bacterium]